jgi:heme-degrading monooxygenase HmoA
MVSRHWTGLVKKERANDYILHLQNETFKKIEMIPGFVSAKILQRELESGIEFLIITDWESIEAIKQFAGEHYQIAVIPQIAKEMMVRFDDEAKHYEIKL